MAAPTITVYQKPTCTTCRQVTAALTEAGVPFESVNYFTDPIPEATLKTLLKKMGLTARQLLRTKEARFKALRLGERELPDAEIVRLMVEFPELIQRPIVEQGPRAILARPADRIRAFLG
ncbi:MAG: arsenate reductase family protein [Vicinamibacterales bacterium]